MSIVIVDEFELFLKKHYTSKYTIKSYLSDAKEFVEKGYSFDKEGIRQFIFDLLDTEKSASTINRKLASLSVFFEFLKSMGVVDKNYVKLTEKPKNDKYLPAFLEVDEIVGLLENIKNLRDRALLELIYSSALRAGEVLGLNVEDIDFDKLKIRVRRKGAKEMYIPISKRASDYLKAYINGRQEGPVFLNRYGKRLSDRSLRKIVKKYALKTIAKDISPHTLRHSRATHLLNSGMDLRLLQKFLGHNTIKATQIYTHLNLKQLAKVYDNSHPLSKDE